MRILVDKSNVVLFIAPNIEFGTFENERKWFISESLYALDGDYTCIDIESIPSEVKPIKYTYTKELGFVINPLWVEPEKPVEEQISELKLSKAISELEIDERISKLELDLA